MDVGRLAVRKETLQSRSPLHLGGAIAGAVIVACIVCTTLLSFASAPAAADTVYKITDVSGHVTYSGTPPNDGSAYEILKVPATKLGTGKTLTAKPGSQTPPDSPTKRVGQLVPDDPRTDDEQESAAVSGPSNWDTGGGGGTAGGGSGGTLAAGSGQPAVSGASNADTGRGGSDSSLAARSGQPATSPKTADPEALDEQLLRERANVRWEKVPRQVLAFYYPWYGNPGTSGRWVHWVGVNEQAQSIGNSTHYPLLGPYDSHDPKVVEQHFRWAKQAGVTGFIVSWWAQNDLHDKAMPLLLDAAQKAGLTVTVLFEKIHAENKASDAQKRENALRDVLYLLERYGKHPAWLKVDGKPVLFIYNRAVKTLKLNGWLWVITQANRKYAGGAVFMGDPVAQNVLRVFDGWFVYGIVGGTQGKSLADIRAWAQLRYPQWVKEGRITCATVMPGYDDSKLERPAPRPVLERYDGQTYRALWEEAIAANPDWVVITSWNEWHEGTEIEPSVENGERELETTAEFASKFLALEPR